MPVVLKNGVMKYKYPNSEKYIGINAISDYKTNEQIEEIEQAGQESKDEIEQFTSEKLDEIDTTIETWMDEHPEVITRIYDNSVTFNNLKTEVREKINNKAPGIFNNVQGSYSFNGVLSPATLDYVYSSTAFGNARYADKLNYMPIASLSTEKNNVTIDVVDRTTILTGTASASTSIYAIDDELPVPAPAGNYTFYFEVDKGSSTIRYGQNVVIRATYADNTQGNLLTQLVQATNVSANVTTNKEIKHIRVEFFYTSKNVYNNHRIWIGMYPSNVTFVDVGQAVTDGSNVSVTFNDITTPIFIDTVQHRGNCIYLTDTKTYVDNNIPEDVVTKPDIAFLTPEMFGAAGNGVSDDTQAIIRCITASRISQDYAIPVRGFNTYKTSSPIEFSARNNNVYIHNINYTGTDAAVILHGVQSNYEFDIISATASGFPSGIQITGTQTEGFSTSTVKCTFIVSRGNCVEFLNDTQNVIYYNTLTFNYQSSLEGNIFHIDGHDINEIDLYGKAVYAANGYFIYDNNEVPQSIIRVHNFCIESGIKYGINTRVYLDNCRTEEFFVKPGNQSYPKQGVLFDFDGKCPHGGIFSNEKTKISYASVDVSNAMSYQDCVDLVGSKFSSASSSEQYSLYGRYIMPDFPVFKFMANYWLNIRPNCSMIVYFNHKAVKPNDEWYYKVSSNFNTGVTNLDYIVPTFFDIDGTSVTINLDDSYCYLAINKFKVKQYENKKAIIYDKLGNLLFDGTTKPAGIYEFECSFVKHDPVVLDLGNGNTYTYSALYSDRVYDGTNEKWEITYIPTVSSDANFQAMISDYSAG